MSRNLSSILADTIAPLRAVLRPLGSPRIGIVLIAAFAMYAGLASLPLLAAAEPGGGFIRVPLRSLAWIDKTEGEWFAWWPSVAMLVGIVVNMTVSMLTRVAWTWRKVPVLLTHVGVAVLALGSAVYASQKREGQIVLTAPMESAGEPAQPITEMTDGNGQNPRAIPGVSLAFRDLTIDSIPGTDLARQVTLAVRAVERGVAAERAVTLNNPLVLSGLSPPTCDCLIRGPIERAWHTWINPVRWKFSIAGWDHEGWLMSREAVIAGMADRPHAGFVVLGVGNTPGVRIIGAGAVMLLVGAAWALLVATFRGPLDDHPSRGSYRHGPVYETRDCATDRSAGPCFPPNNATNDEMVAPPALTRGRVSGMWTLLDCLRRANTATLRVLRGVVCVLVVAAQAPAQSALDPASPLRTVPVQWNGRIAPLDSVARDIVRAVLGRSAVTARGGSSATEDPLTTLLDLVLDPDAVAERPIISTTGVRVPAGTPGFSNPLPRLLSIKEAERLIEAHRAVAGANTDDLRRLLPLAERLSLAKVSVRSLPLLAPARTRAPEANALAHHDWIDAESPLAPPPIAAAMESLRSAWRDADARRTFLAASTLSEALRQHNDGSYPKARVWFEAFMNAVAPMRWGAWLLTFAAAAGLWAFIARLREPAPVPGEPMWSEPDDPSVAGTLHSWLFGLGWLLHAVGFASRWVIAGRLPIQNQYESMLGLCLAATTAAGVFALLAPRRLARQAGTLTFAASVVAMVVLWASHALPIPGVAVEPEAAILGTATLLKYHVSTVLVAYAFIAVGGVLSCVWLMMRAVAPGRPHAAEHLGVAIPVLIKLAFWTLAAGILLGALWADRSWGRWWAFDPKETWALITWCVYLVALHWHAAEPARTMTTAQRTRPLAWLCILGTVIMLWSWFGVNLLLPGLHAYA